MWGRTAFAQGLTTATPGAKLIDPWFDYYFDDVANASVPFYSSYLALGGSQLQAKVGEISSSGANTVVTGVGFQPECLIVFGNSHGFTSNNASVTQWFGVATGTSSNEQWSYYGRRDYLSNFKGHGFFPGELLGGVTLTSFDSDGFSLTNASGFGTYWYLALRDPDASFLAGHSTTSTSSFTTGFRPKVVLLGASGTTASGHDPGNGTSGFFKHCGGFAVDLDGEIVQVAGMCHGQEGLTRVAAYADRVLYMRDAVSVHGSAVMSGFTSTGFNLSWSSVSGARRFGWLAMSGSENWQTSKLRAVIGWQPGKATTLPYDADIPDDQMQCFWGAESLNWTGESVTSTVPRTSGVHTSDAGMLATVYWFNWERIGAYPNSSLVNRNYYIRTTDVHAPPAPLDRAVFDDLNVV